MRKFLTILYSTTLLVACSTTEDPIIPSPESGDGLVAIDFASNLSDQETATRADNYPLEQDFVVSGYKILEEEPRQLVFDNVTVSYNPDATNNPYDYVSTDPDNPQPVRYWDKHATEYRFWAYSTTPTSTTVNQTYDENVVTLSVGDASTPISQVEGFYYSENVKVEPENFGETVKLIFKKLYTIVEIKFFTDPVLSNLTFEEISLSDISFAPNSGEKISVKGQIKIEYPLVDEPKESVTWPEGTLPAMLFSDFSLTESNCGKDNAQTAYHTDSETGTALSVYTLYPTISEYTPFVLSLKVNGVDKQAEVPADAIGWKANHKYVYRFKVDNGLAPVFYDVKVEPWVYGGHQDLEFKNW